jgi:hypothetical protein
MNTIYRLYFFTMAIYLLPVVSLLIFIIDQLTVNVTKMVFWVFFLVGMLPCGLAGTVLSSFGLRKAFKNNNRRNKYLGIGGIVAGIILMFGGLLGLMLIYVVVGE